MTGIAARLRLVTGASLASVPAIVVFAAMSMSPNVMFDILTKHGPAGPWLAVSAVATLVGIAVILAARPVLRHPRTSARDTAIAFAVLSAAALAKSAVVALLSSASTASWPLHVESSAAVGQRTLTNLTYTLLGVGIACAVVTRSREHRQRRRLLLVEQERLVLASATMQESLQLAEEDLRAETHEVLDPALLAVRAALEPQSGDPDTARILDSLSSAVREVIRPMSHRFARESPSVSLPAASSPHEGSDPYALLGAPAYVPGLIRPGLVLVISAATFTFVAPLASPPLAAYVAAGAMYAVTWLALAGIRAAWPSRWRRLSGAGALASLLLVYLAVFGATGYAFANDRLAAQWPSFALMSLGYRTIISMTISMTVLVQQQRLLVDEGIEQVNGELSRQLSVMRREVWAIRRRMSLVLHGSVQSALISAMLLLKEDSGPAGVAEVRQRLDQALTAIDLDAQAATVIEHGLREIASIWAGVAVIDVDASEQALEALADQPGKASAALEIVREAVGNAVRHGRARRIDVTIDLSADSLVEITVRDDGIGLADAGPAGLGTQMLDEVCLTWQRVDIPPGACLQAVLA